MKRQFYRRRLLALSTAVLLGLSSLFPSIAGATEITAEEPILLLPRTLRILLLLIPWKPQTGKQPKKPLNRNA